jgi:predicted metal-dependent hydrolase
LRSLARRPWAPATLRERIEAENREVMHKLRGWGTELGRMFGLRYTALEAERDGVTDWYGVCYEDGVIRIRLRNARSGRLLKESAIVDTLCHELAHLRHLDHGLRFRRLYQRILDRARELGIYRPGPTHDGRPRQGRLFDTGGCGTSAGARRREHDARPV